jgi:alcohol dehydrogenase
VKAMVFEAVGKKSWQDCPAPQLRQPTDAIVRIRKTTICGTDLHILRGSVETTQPGRILGHEGIGHIVQAGDAVSRFAVGDKVLISCITACGRCDHCEIGFHGHCRDGGWLLGNEIDGCQAEFVRVPHADHSLHALPEGGSDDAYVMLSDILPTGLEVGVMEGGVREGSVVAVIGVGPVGLAAIVGCRSRRPGQIIAVDRDPNRLEVARSLGATHAIRNEDGCAAQRILQMTGGQGVHVAIEAIGTPAGWDICEEIVAAGGHIAILGVHGKSVTLHLERMWKRNFTLTAGLVHTHTIPLLLEQVARGEIEPEQLISHRFALSEAMQAYDVFANAAHHRALKVLLENDRT